MADKPLPLHVQVATALRGDDHYIKAGPADILPTHGNPQGPTRPAKPDDYWFEAGNDLVFVKRYDSDWSATGPLIERLGISIMDEAPKWKAMVGAADAYEGLDCDDYATGPTPLLAVCHLILQLHKAGKLPPNV